MNKRHGHSTRHGDGHRHGHGHGHSTGPEPIGLKQVKRGKEWSIDVRTQEWWSTCAHVVDDATVGERTRSHVRTAQADRVGVDTAVFFPKKLNTMPGKKNMLRPGATLLFFWARPTARPVIWAGRALGPLRDPTLGRGKNRAMVKVNVTVHNDTPWAITEQDCTGHTSCFKSREGSLSCEAGSSAQCKLRPERGFMGVEEGIECTFQILCDNEVLDIWCACTVACIVYVIARTCGTQGLLSRGGLK